MPILVGMNIASILAVVSLYTRKMEEEIDLFDIDDVDAVVGNALQQAISHTHTHTHAHTGRDTHRASSSGSAPTRRAGAAAAAEDEEEEEVLDLTAASPVRPRAAKNTNKTINNSENFNILEEESESEFTATHARARAMASAGSTHTGARARVSTGAVGRAAAGRAAEDADAGAEGKADEPGDAAVGHARAGSGRLASSMPLILPKSLRSQSRVTALVQMDDRNFDLSGDMGAIGRLRVLRNEGVLLDVKGHTYAGHIVPSVTCMVVGMGATEARVESIVSDFIQTEHLANLIDSLSGVLTSGNIDPAILQFEDVDGEEDALAVLRARKAKRGEEGVSDSDDDGSAIDAAGGGDDDGVTPSHAGKKRSRAAATGSKTAGKSKGTSKVKAGTKKTRAKAVKLAKPKSAAKSSTKAADEVSKKTPSAKAKSSVAKRKPKASSDDEGSSGPDDVDVEATPSRRASLPRTARSTTKAVYISDSDDDDGEASSDNESDSADFDNDSSDASAGGSDDDYEGGSRKKAKSGSAKKSGKGAAAMMGRRVRVKKTKAKPATKKRAAKK